MNPKSSSAQNLDEIANRDAILPGTPSRKATRLSWMSIPVFEILSGLFCLWYTSIFWQRVSRFWFHHAWTTDDALQQSYPFYKILNPVAFQGDLITKMMECYLAPLHYAISAAVIRLTHDPIIMGHWVMLIQVVATALFMFLAVRAVAGLVPAFFSVAWLLHTRHVMQRLTGGLPRGWSAPVITAYFYCAATGRMNAVLVVIFLGCLLHPPSTLIIALGHGMYLSWKMLSKEGRAEFKGHFIRYLVVSPIFALLTFSVVNMPPEIGKMADYATASQMPEFLKPDGRFPFIPFKEPWTEIKSFGFQAFTGRLHNPGPFLRATLPHIVIASLVGILLIGVRRKRSTIPAPLLFFVAASLITYFASRILAFKLYVPDRHIQFPFALFFVAALSIGAWNAFALTKPPLHRILGQAVLRARLAIFSRKHQIPSVLALVCIGTLVYLGSGLGLQGAMNFNWTVDHRGRAFEWIRNHTAIDAVIAGEPTFIDPVQLFSMRVGYVTTETSHPFYDRYYAEMKRRLLVSLRAHYAVNPQAMLAVLEPEGINYFVFNSRKFSEEALRNEKYFEPFTSEVRSMTSRAVSDYAFRELLQSKDAPSSPVVFADSFSMIVDVKLLRTYLENRALK